MPSASILGTAQAKPPGDVPRFEKNAELDALLCDIRQRFDVAFDSLDVDETPLQVLTIRNMRAHLDTLLRRGVRDPLRQLPLWAKIWPGSFVLGRLLRRYAPEGRTLLELGAGCGILGLVAARYGFSRIVLSDVEEDALRFARANVLRNGLADRVDVARLDVAQAEMARVGGDARSLDLPRKFDMIAASELLYLEHLHQPLVRFVEHALAPAGMAFFCTDMARAKPRFAALAAKTFRIKEGHIRVKARDAEGDETRRVYTILILERP